jgi:hypothetical protein
MYFGRRTSARGGAAMLIGVVAVLATYDGIGLAIRESALAHDGRVTPGIIVRKHAPDARDGEAATAAEPRSRRARRLRAIETWLGLHQSLAQLVLTGSRDEWVVEYRYECERSRGCRGEQVVPESLWHRLRIEQPVSVRRENGDMDSSRLDEYTGSPRAIATLGSAVALLLIAVALTGRLTVPSRRYLTAPAVVMAVEPIKYNDATRWRVRFAYFDPAGTAQESVSEVVVNTLKTGDDCVAVFSPDRPDLAWFRPLGTA